ncbi:hypothetical protein HY469_04580 [Candidatus Roizmanbacteria bacterium]|nr:hypothetical protein [Candidatus Roizmanbacteria bacterium]
MAKQPRVRSEKEEFKHKQIEVVDIDKRAFLKLIGAAGVYFFLSSLFSRRGETLFFDRIANQDGNPLENSTGNQTYPVVRQPTDGYQISEIDDGDITFLGYTNQTGNWYIMKGDPETGSYRYTKGESDFARSWNNRKNLHYVYFYELFAAR